MITSCAQVYYPAHINSSFIEEKGETNLGAAISLSSINLQASHALSPHLRIAGGINAWAWQISGDGYAGTSAHLLTGYYSKIGSKTFLEAYAGVGANIGNEDFFGQGILQSSIGFGKDQPKFVVSLRANYMDNAIFSDPNEGLSMDPGVSNKVSGMQYDFAFTHRFVKSNKTWFLQYGISGGDIQNAVGDQPVLTFINFGVNWRLFSKSYSTSPD